MQLTLHKTFWSSAINPTQDFLARMGGGRLFEVGASAVKYGNCDGASPNRKVYRIQGKGKEMVYKT